MEKTGIFLFPFVFYPTQADSNCAPASPRAALGSYLSPRMAPFDLSLRSDAESVFVRGLHPRTSATTLAGNASDLFVAEAPPAARTPASRAKENRKQTRVQSSPIFNVCNASRSATRGRSNTGAEAPYFKSSLSARNSLTEREIKNLRELVDREEELVEVQDVEVQTHSGGGDSGGSNDGGIGIGGSSDDGLATQEDDVFIGPRNTGKRRRQVVTTLGDRLKVQRWMRGKISGDTPKIKVPHMVIKEFLHCFEHSDEVQRQSALKRAHRWCAEAKKTLDAAPSLTFANTKEKC